MSESGKQVFTSREGTQVRDEEKMASTDGEILNRTKEKPSDSEASKCNQENPRQAVEFAAKPL